MDSPLPCHICDRMRTRNPRKHGGLVTEGEVQTCLLCNRDFCATHKGKFDGICEINHASYFWNHQELRGIYPSLEARQKALEEMQKVLEEAQSHGIGRGSDTSL
ncbi:uncharacterized protein EI97DRAFT_429229 [Westerdykella ornata]|uniref:Uncharacterized protein n=1 Tax=Westerdykella ornata TaxID=318751 RepID=A0A6A6JXN2_WESOR|nr:uncharacterized protein EI97DRAFT_429229 [Westerdykella ornata]KAF2281167.1 hypothetical protein EI97DRAFT_429229 [Westerdykella ornata]